MNTAQPSPSLPAVYPLLADTRNLAADRALIEALPRLPAGYRELALDTLLQRGRDGALADLVARFAEFDEPLRSLILTKVEGVFAGVRIAISSKDFDSRASAIDLIRRSGNAKLAYLLAGVLTHRCSKTRALAAEAMSRLAQRFLERRAAARAGRCDPTLGEWGRTLAAAVRQALACWDAHFRTEIVVSATWLAEWLEDVILARVKEPRSKLAYVFNEMLRGALDPGQAGYVLRMLRAPALRAKAARMIAACRDTRAIRAVLDESWLLADPDVARSLPRVRSLAWLERGIAPLLALSPGHMRAAARLIGATGLSPASKVALFREMSNSGQPVLEEAGVWELVRIESEAATGALRCIARQGDGRLSRIAARELRRRSPSESMPPPAGSTAPNAAGHDARSPFDRYWAQFDDLGTVERAERGRKLRDTLPDFDQQLRAKLKAGDPSDRVRGVLMVRALEVAGEMDSQLYSLAHDPDPMVRSAVIAALRPIVSPTTRRILWAALHDTDERVQANAIEALDALEANRFPDPIKDKLESSNNRVRANAILSLLKLEVREAADALLAMLDSHSRADRLSALWVIDCLQLQSVTDRLVALAATDPDPQVRHRARRIVETTGLRCEREKKTPDLTVSQKGNGS